MNNKRLNIYLLLISFTLFLVGCYLLCSSIHRLFPDTDGIEGVELSSQMKEVEEKREMKNPNIINNKTPIDINSIIGSLVITFLSL